MTVVLEGRLRDLISTADRQLESQSYDAAVDTYRTALAEASSGAADARAQVESRLEAAVRAREISQRTAALLRDARYHQTAGRLSESYAAVGGALSLNPGNGAAVQLRDQLLAAAPELAAGAMRPATAGPPVEAPSSEFTVVHDSGPSVAASHNAGTPAVGSKFATISDKRSAEAMRDSGAMTPTAECSDVVGETGVLERAVATPSADAARDTGVLERAVATRPADAVRDTGLLEPASGSAFPTFSDARSADAVRDTGLLERASGSAFATFSDTRSADAVRDTGLLEPASGSTFATFRDARSADAVRDTGLLEPASGSTFATFSDTRSADAVRDTRSMEPATQSSFVAEQNAAPIEPPAFHLIEDDPSLLERPRRETYTEEPPLSILNTTPPPEEPAGTRWIAAISAAFLCIGLVVLAANKNPARRTSRAAPDQQTFSASDGATRPTLISKVDPEYTDEARAAGIEGTVLLYVAVETDGRATVLGVLRGLDTGLDERARQAVAWWRFQPGTKDGQPARVLTQVEVNFRLQ